MVKKNYAACAYFESPCCPNVNSREMQQVYSPNSEFKVRFDNIADDMNIILALDMCAKCRDFKQRTAAPCNKT